MRRHFLVFFLVVVFGLPKSARAEPTRELIMSSAYGVLAGTLVGAATLAFTDRPGDNLKNIARGASLGLYAGILLGLYVAYVVPDGEGDEEGEEAYDEQTLRPTIYPILTSHSIEGAGVSMKLLAF